MLDEKCESQEAIDVQVEQDRKYLKPFKLPKVNRILVGENDYLRFKILREFVSNLIENIEDTEPEYNEIINEHFWEFV